MNKYIETIIYSSHWQLWLSKNIVFVLGVYYPLKRIFFNTYVFVTIFVDEVQVDEFFGEMTKSRSQQQAKKVGSTKRTGDKFKYIWTKWHY